MLTRMRHIVLFFWLCMGQSIFGQISLSMKAIYPVSHELEKTEIWDFYINRKARGKSLNEVIKNNPFHNIVFLLPEETKERDYILQVPDYKINRLFVYGVDSVNHRVRQLIVFGDEIDRDEYLHHTRTVQARLHKGEFTHLIASYNRPGNIPQLPVVLWETAEYLNHWGSIESAYGVLLGLLISYLFYILLAGWLTKNYLFGVFGFWIFTYILYYFISSGFVKFYLLPHFNEFYSFIRLIIVVFGLFTINEFALRHYELRNNARFFVWFWYFFIALTIVLNSFIFLSGINLYEGYEAQFVWLVRILVIVFIIENFYLPIRYYNRTGKVTYLTYLLLISILAFGIYLYQAMYIVDLDVDRFILGISILLVLEIFAIALGIAWYTLKEKKQIIDLLNERNSLQVESNLAQYHIRQNERRIIATDLHDDVLNRLSMLASLSTEGVITVKEIKSRLQQISEDIKSYTRSLYPIWIDKQPLEELLLDYFKSYAQSKGIQFGLNISKDVLTIPKMKKLQIFRIAQEFFQNSIKYGQPTEIHFELMRIEQDLLINLRDNGVGFDPNQMEKGIGMISLETRVKALRGEVEIFSRMGEGVRWKVKLPIQ